MFTVDSISKMYQERLGIDLLCEHTGMKEVLEAALERGTELNGNCFWCPECKGLVRMEVRYGKVHTGLHPFAREDVICALIRNSPLEELPEALVHLNKRIRNVAKERLQKLLRSGGI